MNIKNALRAIKEQQNAEAMGWLDCMTEKALTKMMDEQSDNYFEYQLHKYAYGDHLTEEEAVEWVNAMQNKDGSYSGHWNYREIDNLYRGGNYSYNANDFYAVVNMMYSDYYDPKMTIDDFVRMACDWLDDADAPSDKTVRYYYLIAKKKKEKMM